jgi:hypothetical protein
MGFKLILFISLFLLSCAANKNQCNVIPVDEGTFISCTDGTNYTVYNGKNGSNGENGISCIVNRTVEDDGALITCGDIQVFIYDGEDGVNSIIEIIHTCPDIKLPYREVLLRLSDGNILASFSDSIAGYNTRFSLLQAGNYMNTDGSYCYFSVDEDLMVKDMNGNTWEKKR